MQWWLDHLSAWNGKTLIAHKPSLVESDTTRTSWGAVWTRTGGPWSEAELKWYINCLEAFSGFPGGKTFGSPQSGGVCQPPMGSDQQGVNTIPSLDSGALWKSQPWYLKLLEMLTDFLLKIAMEQDIVSQASMCPATGCWNISGVDSETRAFQKWLHSCFLRRGDKILHSLTTQPLRSGYAGVTNGILILFQAL